VRRRSLTPSSWLTGGLALFLVGKFTLCKRASSAGDSQVTGSPCGGAVLADRFYPSSRTCSACGLVNGALTLSDRRWTCPGCGADHDRDENAGTNLANLPASWAETASDGKTAPVRRVAVNRVNHPGRAAA
jgi:hypothetical protein